MTLAHRALLIAAPLVAFAAIVDVPESSAEAKPRATGADELSQERLEELTKEIAADLEEMRGVAFPRPVAVALASREGFLEYAKKRMERDTTPQELRAEETVSKLLGLLPPDMDLLATTMDVLEEQVGGFYDPSTEAFYLMDSFQGDLAHVILAHELTHALDDQLYDIDGTLDRLAGNSDAQLAYHAVVEGSGTAMMNAWMIDAIKRKRLKPSDLEDVPGLESEAMSRAPEYIWKPLLASYMRGLAFLVRTESAMVAQVKRPKNEDIAAAFTDPPRSTEQILHPDKYWNEEDRDEPRELAFHPGVLHAGWRVESEDTLGELGLALFANPPEERASIDLGKNAVAVMRIQYTNEAAEGWGGDRYVLLAKDGARAVVSVSVWDTPADAGEFLAAAESARGRILESNLRLAADHDAEGAGVRVDAIGTDQVFFASWYGADEREIDALLESLTWRELSAREGKQEF